MPPSLSYKPWPERRSRASAIVLSPAHYGSWLLKDVMIKCPRENFLLRSSSLLLVRLASWDHLIARLGILWTSFTAAAAPVPPRAYLPPLTLPSVLAVSSRCRSSCRPKVRKDRSSGDRAALGEVVIRRDETRLD